MTSESVRQSSNGPPEVSALLKEGRNQGECRQWLADMIRMHSHLSAAMGIMHPDMYRIGREAMIKLWEGVSASEATGTLDVLRLWTSIYNSLSVMANQCSTCHLDKMGKPEWFDQLLTVGNYQDLCIVFPTLQLAFNYPPGTMRAFYSKLLVHGAPCVDGDRGCIAWYMQDKIHRVMNVPKCNYAHLEGL